MFYSLWENILGAPSSLKLYFKVKVAIKMLSTSRPTNLHSVALSSVPSNDRWPERLHYRAPPFPMLSDCFQYCFRLQLFLELCCSGPCFRPSDLDTEDGQELCSSCSLAENWHVKDQGPPSAEPYHKTELSARSRFINMPAAQSR